MLEEVSEEELNKVIHSFKKGKSPGPNGFTLNLFLGFNDFLKDIMKVIKEYQKSGNILGAMNATFITLIPKNHKGETFEDY